MARLTFSTVAIIANSWLLSGVFAAQHYPRQTAVNGTAIPTKTSSSSGSVTSFYSAIRGPFIAAVSSTWSQVIIPTTVGTVMVVVNAATNETTSTTIYHTDFLKNGSSTLLSRTDTDVAGTVTQVVTDYQNNQTMTVTYPSNYFEVADSLTWDAILPTTVEETTCCFQTPTLSATPSHTPFVQIGELDDEDTRGWYYTLVGVNFGDPFTVLDSTEVSSLWSGQTLAIEYDGCPYTYCTIQVSSAAPASGVKAQPGAILATSTTTISIPSETPTEPTTSPTTSSSFTAIPDQDTTTPSPAPIPTPSPPPVPTPSTSPPPPPENTQPPSTQVSGGSPPISSSQIPQPSPSPPETSETSQAQQPAPGTIPASQEPPTGTTQTPGTPQPPAGSTQTPGSQQSPSPVPQPGTTDSVPGPAQTISGSIPSSGSVPSSDIVPSASTPAVIPVPIITIGSSAIPANSASQFIVSGQTLAPGSSITIGSGSSTTVVALQTSDSNTVLVVGDSSSTLAPAVTSPAVVTVGGSVVTADSSSNFVIDGQTLSPGGSPITVGGTTISLAAEGTQIVEGTKTLVQTTGIGGIIWSVFGGESGTATVSATGASGSGSSATPTYVQASGAIRIQPFWSVGALVAVCCMILM
ncbi:hypothetical protein BKA64DRAFT_406986 [Cadophora sp. MPI-SDFR-AT-0126]|nr:hypothetical protein BKA64DRAFT_406986 [Leotiomycetes sp. MPI-SDFR-AT-0126]